MSGSYAHDRSPTPGLFLGLIITLAAVVAYSGYITRQVYGLRELQNNLVDRNRKDSLQLLRIQNDLNLLGLAVILIKSVSHRVLEASAYCDEKPMATITKKELIDRIAESEGHRRCGRLALFS